MLSPQRGSVKMTLMNSTRPRLGVALGGGTARGLAHVGALKVLEAHGSPPDMIAGTSYGAIMAALYALGMPGVALDHLLRQQNNLEIWTQGVDFGLHRLALIHGRKLAQWLDRKFFFGATFEDAEIPLAIGCTDLGTGELVVISEGSIAVAVQASCALPLYFAPVRWQGRFLVDGGFVEPVPFQTLKTLKPDLMVGLHTGIEADRSRFIQGVRWLGRTPFGRAFHRLAQAVPLSWPLGQLLRGCSVTAYSYEHRVAAPPGALLVRAAPNIAWWDFHRSPVAIAAGEVAMEEALDQIPFGRVRPRI